MNAGEAKEVLTIELAKAVRFNNLHGITAENIASFCVAPFEVDVDPDDGTNQTRRMWVVISEHRLGGYSIAYNSQSSEWAVIEPAQNGRYVCVIAANTLSGALDGM